MTLQLGATPPISPGIRGNRNLGGSGKCQGLRRRWDPCPEASVSSDDFINYGMMSRQGFSVETNLYTEAADGPEDRERARTEKRRTQSRDRVLGKIVVNALLLPWTCPLLISPRWSAGEDERGQLL